MTSLEKEELTGRIKGGMDMPITNDVSTADLLKYARRGLSLNTCFKNAICKLGLIYTSDQELFWDVLRYNDVLCNRKFHNE